MPNKCKLRGPNIQYLALIIYLRLLFKLLQVIDNSETIHFLASKGPFRIYILFAWIYSYSLYFRNLV
jgi:hypothetical protein